jgi:hypothetical protein
MNFVVFPREKLFIFPKSYHCHCDEASILNRLFVPVCKGHNKQHFFSRCFEKLEQAWYNDLG